MILYKCKVKLGFSKFTAMTNKMYNIFGLYVVVYYTEPLAFINIMVKTKYCPVEFIITELDCNNTV